MAEECCQRKGSNLADESNSPQLGTKFESEAVGLGLSEDEGSLGVIVVYGMESLGSWDDAERKDNTQSVDQEKRDLTGPDIFHHFKTTSFNFIFGLIYGFWSRELSLNEFIL